MQLGTSFISSNLFKTEICKWSFTLLSFDSPHEASWQVRSTFLQLSISNTLKFHLNHHSDHIVILTNIENTSPPTQSSLVNIILQGTWFWLLYFGFYFTWHNSPNSVTDTQPQYSGSYLLCQFIFLPSLSTLTVVSFMPGLWTQAFLLLGIILLNIPLFCSSSLS